MVSFVVLTIFKNEKTNLKEWIDHYLWQGASHLYMCDNDSTDNPLEILQPYIEKGLITYWIDKDHAKYHNFTRHIQKEIYQSTVSAIQTQAKITPDWILIADLDEFWYSSWKTIQDEIQRLPPTIQIIYANWRIFGPSEFGEHPVSLRKELVYRRPNETSPKYMFRTFAVDPVEIDIHCINHTFNESEILRNSPTIHLNHYVLQSFWYWANVKIPRGCIVGDASVYTIDYWNRELEGHTVLDRQLADQVEKSESEAT